MLDALAAAGMVLSLATAKPEETAVRILEHFGLADRFAVLAGATYEPGRRTKDEVITHALRELGIEPGAHVVMVGDRDHDVHGAAVHGIDMHRRPVGLRRRRRAHRRRRLGPGRDPRRRRRSATAPPTKRSLLGRSCVTAQCPRGLVW